MELLHVALTAILSIVVLFLLTKLMGNKQMSQLSMFDYINGITIGSIAAEMATSLEDDFLQPLVAMIIYAFFVLAVSILTNKSIKLRKFFTGKSLILLNDGKIYNENLEKAKLDVNDLLMQARNNGYFDVSSLQSAILEPNGTISFMPKAELRPATPQDLNLSVKEEKPEVNVIIDGKVLEDNLKYTGNDITWLKRELAKNKISKISEVFLAACSYDNQLSIYKKTNKEMSRDMFE